MQNAQLDGVSLACETTGSGEPLVLIHGSMIADAYAPMVKQPALSRFKALRYHRRGYGKSEHTEGTSNIPQQASDCLALMRHLDIGKAHLVGHSYGGVIALELARSAPEAVASLSLLEPPLLAGVPENVRDRFMQRALAVGQRYQSGDERGAVDGFLTLVMGRDRRADIERAVPGGFSQAVADARTLFDSELGALPLWQFTAEDAPRIKCPVLAVVGVLSPDFFQEVQRSLQAWFPRVETAVIPGADHGLQMFNPREVAEAIGTFLDRHRMN